MVEHALAQEWIEQATIREAPRGIGRQGSGQYRSFRKPGDNTRGMGSVSHFEPSSSRQNKRKFEGSRFRASPNCKLQLLPELRYREQELSVIIVDR